MTVELPVGQPEHRDVSSRLIARYLIREGMGVIVLAVALFWPAGRLDWLMGWALVGMTFVWASATATILITRAPSLIAERLGPRKGAKTWDLAIMSIVGLTTLARLLVAGLDERFDWTTGIPLWSQVVALVVAAACLGIGVWAIAANAYFSQLVRIQKERNHQVATGGPYRFTRHPAYLGTVLFELSVPLMLGSWWALIPGAVGAALIVIRTYLEDRTLMQELEGYRAYSAQVPYRLVPGIW